MILYNSQFVIKIIAKDLIKDNYASIKDFLIVSNVNFGRIFCSLDKSSIDLFTLFDIFLK